MFGSILAICAPPPLHCVPLCTVWWHRAHSVCAPPPLRIPWVGSVIVGKTPWQVATGATIFHNHQSDSIQIQIHIHKQIQAKLLWGKHCDIEVTMINRRYGSNEMIRRRMVMMMIVMMKRRWFANSTARLSAPLADDVVTCVQCDWVPRLGAELCAMQCALNNVSNVLCAMCYVHKAQNYVQFVQPDFYVQAMQCAMCDIVPMTILLFWYTPRRGQCMKL